MSLELEASLDDFDVLLARMWAVVPAHKKIWIWRSMVRLTLKLNRQRVREQKNLDGSAYEKRSDGTARRMFPRILRASQLKVFVEGEGFIIEQPNKVAWRHHFGHTRTEEAKTHEELYKQTLEIKNTVYHKDRQRRKEAGEQDPAPGKPCSKKQARALKRQLGFKKSLKWLQATFTTEQAGYLIRKDRVMKGQPPKSRWQVRLPARQLLGMSRSDVESLKTELSQLIEKYHYIHEKKET